MKITVKIFEGSTELLSKVFAEGVYRAGRSDFADIVLEHESISRSQIEFRVTDSSVYVTNMGTPGRLKRNAKAVETGELADGDELMIGPYRIVVYHGEREEEFNVPLPEEAPSSEEPSPIDIPEPEPIGDESDERPELKPSEGTAQLVRQETQVEIKPVVAKLLFTEGPRKGEEIFLEAYEATMGRSRKADIFLDDEKLSRIHAKVSRVGMGFRLIDLNSRNGTYVNGMRVLEHPLSSFDEIQIGSTKIKFLIHDMASSDAQKGELIALSPPGSVPEQTRSLGVAPMGATEVHALATARQEPQSMDDPYAPWASDEARKRKQRLLVGSLIIVVLMYLLVSSQGKKETAPVVAKPAPEAQKLISDFPPEFQNYSDATKRKIEGLYNLAEKSFRAKDFPSAKKHLDALHTLTPYYKQSLEMRDKVEKLMQQLAIQQTEEESRKASQNDLQTLISEGKDYLKEGDFERAAEAFRSALTIDPANKIATKGLKAADAKVRSIEEIPPDRNPVEEKKKLVVELLKQATDAYRDRSYQKAIELAEKVRAIEIPGESSYLHDAKLIIDQAHIGQKEEFEPFLQNALERCAEGDYNTCRDLSEEMLKRDPSYDPAKELLGKAKKQLNRLAKEAYTHGYILENMNRLEEAKQYYIRASNFVRPGDDYFDKVKRKLDNYN